MKKSRFSDAQIMGILAQAENGVPIPELCREHGMSNASFYKWRAKFGGMDASMVSQMKSMDDENKRLKKMYAELRIRHAACPHSEKFRKLKAISDGAGFRVECSPAAPMKQIRLIA